LCQYKSVFDIFTDLARHIQSRKKDVGSAADSRQLNSGFAGIVCSAHENPDIARPRFFPYRKQKVFA
jgi:hypothetical protein